jgi:outer membrane receptor protein involved in Fe transport
VIGVNANAVVPIFLPEVDLYTAKNLWVAQNGSANTGPTTFARLGILTGDTGGVQVKHGVNTPGTDLLYATKSRRDAYAAYTQGVWDINEDFTLTFGLRYAKDDLQGEESVYRSRTFCDVLAACNTGAIAAALRIPYLIDPRSTFYDPVAAQAGVANSLAAYNVFRGALDPVTLLPTGNAIVLSSPSAAVSAFRKADRSDSEITWRLNLDWDIDDSQMMYFSVTTGYRGGGYNLVFFSSTQTYDPEELISYEIGYKGNLIDNTLQLNASIYLYDYETIHTFGTEASALGGTTTSVLEAPGAEIYGVEIEALWLATDRITLGGNYSYTPSEYTEQLLISNGGDETCPFSLFNALLDCTRGIKGNQVLNVANHKGAAWASYNLPLADSGAVDFTLAASWIDESFNTQFETDIDAAPSYERLDFRATWTSPSEQWVVTAFVENVLDEVGVRQLEAQGEDSGYRRDGMVSEPRMYGIEVTYGLGTN